MKPYGYKMTIKHLIDDLYYEDSVRYKEVIYMLEQVVEKIDEMKWER